MGGETTPLERTCDVCISWHGTDSMPRLKDARAERRTRVEAEYAAASPIEPPRISKVSRRVELMTTALKTMRRITTKNPRERLVVMTAGARRKGVGERE